MAKLIMMKGLPACGKSTRVKELIEEWGNWVRVNRDLLRTMLHFDKWTPKNEKLTVEAEKALVRHYLSKGVNVFVDDTNMSDSHEEMWKTITKECGGEFAKLEKDTPVDECLRREDERQKVGRNVIYKMALQFNKLDQPEKPFVLCDIDGTVADCEHRRDFVTGEKKDWKGFFGAMQADKPRREVIEMLKKYADDGHKIIFLTARPEDYRKVTENWIELFVASNLPKGSVLTIIMRNSGDSRPDTEVKQQMLEKYFKDKYPIETMIDDRPSVIRMWKEQGVPL